MAAALQVVGAVGLCLSLYAVHVEFKNEEDSSYEAVCDISESMSCSRVLMSEWGHLMSQVGLLPKGHPLDLANATYGVAYFTVVVLHGWLPLPSQRAKSGAIFALTVPVVAVSVFLAYILIAVLQDLCLVCTAIYVVSLAVLIISYRGFAGGGRGEAGADSRGPSIRPKSA